MMYLLQCVKTTRSFHLYPEDYGTDVFLLVTEHSLLIHSYMSIGTDATYAKAHRGESPHLFLRESAERFCVADMSNSGYVTAAPRKADVFIGLRDCFISSPYLVTRLFEYGQFLNYIHSMVSHYPNGLSLGLA